MSDPKQVPHRRRNPLNGEWVLVSPQRSERPWLGLTERAEGETLPAHDPACHLCPRSTRASGTVNPDYRGVWVFDNDFPALAAGVPDLPAGDEIDPLFQAEAVSGTCRVICFSPDHARPIARLSKAEVRAVVDCWAAQSSELGARHAWVQIFENRGAMMGCSNPHPHGQIWASDWIPVEPAAEDREQRDYHSRHGRPLLADVAHREADGPRLVTKSDRWLVIVPWWATWPFETLLLPRFPVLRMESLEDGARDDLAETLRVLTGAYDALFDCPFPYSMGWHGAPHAPGSHHHWQLHAHFYPPLLRSATVRKFMVGYEMLAEAQRDMTAEQAAERLRAALQAAGQ